MSPHRLAVLFCLLPSAFCLLPSSHANLFEMITLCVVITSHVHSVELAERSRDVNQRQLAGGRNPARRDHATEIACGHRVGCTRAKQHAHDAINRRGRTAALRMAE